MRIFLLLYVFLAFSGTTYAQSDSVNVDSTSKTERFRLRNARLIIKTDALALLNSVLSEGTFDFSVAGELCFSQRYSLQLNIYFDRDNNTINKRTGFRYGPEFKQYIPCTSYSVLYVGAYFNFENATTTVDHLRFENKFLKYRESGFEVGLSGGFKAKITGRWIINPAAYTGISNIYSSRILEALNTSHIEKPDILNVRVVLGIGYRF